jgi:dTDP-4-dehydrorhamnose reductase
MRILILGANGQLAHDLIPALAEDEVIGFTHSDLDICDKAALEDVVRRYQPACLINTAAFHRVDDCEEQVEKSFGVNAVAVHNLVRAANAVGATLVHFSTDYVFDGALRRPYVEGDSPAPLSIYGLSKLAGEIVVRRYAQKHFLIRTCGLYGCAGSSGKGGNFVETVFRLAREGKPIRVVNDQILTPTSTKDLAAKLAPLLHTDRYGLYHMTSAGQCSWFEFAQEIFRLAGLAPGPQPTTTAAFGARARRPAYSVLDNQAYRQAGFSDFRLWREALADYIKSRRQP